MEKTKEEILLEKYLAGKASESERAIVESWYVDRHEDGPAPSLGQLQAAQQKVWSQLSFTREANRVIRLWPRVAAAVAVVLVGVGLYFYKGSDDRQTGTVVYTNDIAPGVQTAMLTLADGSKIRLADVASGEVAREAGVSIVKTTNGQLIYEIKNSSVPSNKINTLSTSNGETYQLRLPDGTLVWLNAASSISYPASFASLKTRNVQTTGEVYFEAAKDKLHPFVVETKGWKTQVLGTHFNVNGYADEPLVRTTLLEGSVNMVGSTGQQGLLKPGQQASGAANGDLKIAEVDTQLATAWKNGVFHFEDTDIREVMRQLSRWYDVQVEYDPGVKPSRFTGKLYRSMKASQVLEGLGFTGLKFKIEGKKIIVTQ